MMMDGGMSVAIRGLVRLPTGVMVPSCARSLDAGGPLGLMELNHVIPWSAARRHTSRRPLTVIFCVSSRMGGSLVRRVTGALASSVPADARVTPGRHDRRRTRLVGHTHQLGDGADLQFGHDA